MCFLLVPKLVTLNDLERRNGRYFTLFHRIRWLWGQIGNYVKVVGYISDKHAVQKNLLFTNVWTLCGLSNSILFLLQTRSVLVNFVCFSVILLFIRSSETNLFNAKVVSSSYILLQRVHMHFCPPYYDRVTITSASATTGKLLEIRNAVTLSAEMNVADDEEYKCNVKSINWLHGIYRYSKFSVTWCHYWIWSILQQQNIYRVLSLLCQYNDTATRDRSLMSDDSVSDVMCVLMIISLATCGPAVCNRPVDNMLSACSLGLAPSPAMRRSIVQACTV